MSTPLQKNPKRFNVKGNKVILIKVITVAPYKWRIDYAYLLLVDLNNIF